MQKYTSDFIPGKHSPANQAAVSNLVLELVARDLLIFQPTKQAGHYVAKAVLHNEEPITVQYIRGRDTRTAIGIFLPGLNFWLRSWQSSGLRPIIFSLANHIARQQEHIHAPAVLAALQQLLPESS